MSTSPGTTARRGLRMAAVGVLCAGAGAARAQPEFGDGEVRGTLNSTALREISGVAASRVNEGVLWCHNDSGDSARVFAIDTTGRLLGTYAIAGGLAFDYEDIAVGPGPVPGASYVYVGDIGDNLQIRPNLRVYRAPEPMVPRADEPVSGTLNGATTIGLAYPDGPRDAEALLVDPVTGDLFIVTKAAGSARVYRASAQQLVSGSAATMAYVGSVNLDGAGRRVTAGDVSPDGRFVLLRGLDFATVFVRGAGQGVGEAILGPGAAVPVVGPAAEPQGEAIGFDGAAHGYFTVSEGEGAALHWFARRCLPDHNGVGGVTVQDIYDFLSAWQSRQGAADFNAAPGGGSGSGVSVQDVYDFLLAWQAGCP